MSEVDMVVKMKNVHPRRRSILVKWLTREGQLVKKGDPLYIFENLKGVFEVPSEFDGKVQKLLVARGSQVVAQQDLAILRTDADGGASTLPFT